MTLTQKISVLHTSQKKKKKSQRFQKEWSLVILYREINRLNCQASQNGYKDELLHFWENVSEAHESFAYGSFRYLSTLFL